MAVGVVLPKAGFFILSKQCNHPVFRDLHVVLATVVPAHPPYSIMGYFSVGMAPLQKLLTRG